MVCLTMPFALWCGYLAIFFYHDSVIYHFLSFFIISFFSIRVVRCLISLKSRRSESKGNRATTCHDVRSVFLERISVFFLFLRWRVKCLRDLALFLPFMGYCSSFSSSVVNECNKIFLHSNCFRKWLFFIVIFTPLCYFSFITDGISFTVLYFFMGNFFFYR